MVKKLSEQEIIYPAIVREARRITVPKKYGVKIGTIVMVKLEVVSEPTQSQKEVISAI
jgi:hypothetical protein